MADKRMFTKKITDDENFINLSSSAQALYFHLCMCADDDGFTTQISTSMFKAHASVQDFEALMEKRYVFQFENGVIVIKHWRMANALRKDRYTPTVYKEELMQLGIKEDGAYTLNPDGCRLVANWLPQERIGKDRLDKDSLDKDRIGEDSTEDEPLEAEASRSKTDCYTIVSLFNETCPSYPKVTALSDARRKAIKARLRTYTLDDFKTVFQIAESSPFLKGANDRNWSANFDWLIKDANFAKVLDGNYTHGGNAQPKPKLSKAAQDLEDAYAMIADWAAKGDD